MNEMTVQLLAKAKARLHVVKKELRATQAADRRATLKAEKERLEKLLNTSHALSALYHEYFTGPNSTRVRHHNIEEEARQKWLDERDSREWINGVHVAYEPSVDGMNIVPAQYYWAFRHFTSAVELAVEGASLTVTRLNGPEIKVSDLAKIAARCHRRIGVHPDDTTFQYFEVRDKDRQDLLQLIEQFAPPDVLRDKRGTLAQKLLDSLTDDIALMAKEIHKQKKRRTKAA